MKILLAPHADDETLFACYTLLRERPHVVLCLPGARRHGSLSVRIAEFGAAMEVLGCQWISIADELDEPLEDLLARFDADQIYAPLPEEDGNDEHNLIGDIAAQLWRGKVTFYTTYTPGARTTRGEAVPFEEDWPALKREALACYRSQQAIPGIRAHFSRPLDEYLVSWQTFVCQQDAGTVLA